MKRRPEFRDWLKMLRQNGKFLYVITGEGGEEEQLITSDPGSHVDFASHVASYALGEDWWADWEIRENTFLLYLRMDLFDIVIFFARKPSFFIDRRPFWKLEAEKEVRSLL